MTGNLAVKYKQCNNSSKDIVIWLERKAPAFKSLFEVFFWRLTWEGETFGMQ